jgi:2-dehydro-3-deoxygluconokinase
MTSKKIFCFGELLIRYSPDVRGGWIKEKQMPVFIGGSELNVSMALSRWKVPVVFCTALPKNFLTGEIENFLSSSGIDISSVVHHGKRIGIYYLQEGADLNAAVLYDRANSSFSELRPGMIDWDTVLEEISWFHFSAINPALNDNLALVCKEALEIASKKNITISVDLNYRKMLWQPGREKEIMRELVKYCDVVMGNVWAAHTFLGIDVLMKPGDQNSDAYSQHSITSADEIRKMNPKCRIVANTFRANEGSTGIKYFAALHSEDFHFFSPELTTERFVSKVGTGDCFMAGLIYGLINKNPLQEVVDFAAAAAFGKLQEETDFTNQGVEAILERVDQLRIKNLPAGRQVKN